MKIVAVIPTGNRPHEYQAIYTFCTARGVDVVTIATSDMADGYAQGVVLHDRELNISKWWNMGMDKATELGAEAIAILNDDATLPNNWFAVMSTEIAKGASGAAGCRPWDTTKMAGWAFMLSAKDNIRADENIKWHYTDDDIERQCEAKNGLVLVPGIRVLNKYGNSTIKPFEAQIKLDKQYYHAKYSLREMHPRLDVTVIVATFGNGTWEEMGDKAALSALKTGASVKRVHLKHGTLAQARNYAIEQVTTEYLCFLDADDDLPPDYFDFTPTADITATAIIYPHSKAPIIPKVWAHEPGRPSYHDGGCNYACLIDGNWIHIGAVMKTDIAKTVLFREYPIYEDWAHFLEHQQRGSTIGRNEKSVYRAAVRQSPGHRNSSLPIARRNLVHAQIIRDIVGVGA